MLCQNDQWCAELGVELGVRHCKIANNDPTLENKCWIIIKI